MISCDMIHKHNLYEKLSYQWTNSLWIANYIHIEWWTVWISQKHAHRGSVRPPSSLFPWPGLLQTLQLPTWDKYEMTLHVMDAFSKIQLLTVSILWRPFSRGTPATVYITRFPEIRWLAVPVIRTLSREELNVGRPWLMDRRVRKVANTIYPTRLLLR